MAEMILGVIGSNVCRSFSPAIHQAFFAAAGIEGQYRLLNVDDHELASTLNQLTSTAISARGINVTIPHKVAIIEQLDHVDTVAQSAGAVNTVVFDYDNQGQCRRSGFNTDIAGLLSSLRNSLEDSLPNLNGPGLRQYNRAAVIGLGGAARAAVIALVQMGITDMVLIGRSLERGRSFIDTMKVNGVSFSLYSIENECTAECRAECRAECTAEGAENHKAMLNSLSACSILINATSIGHHDSDCPKWLPELISVLPSSAFVQDLVYAKSEVPTVVFQLAHNRQLDCADGKAMLVHQARHAFHLWTGFLPPYAVGMEALTKAIKEI